LYAKLRAGDKNNLFFSPYSLSTILAMGYAGARGETAAEMAKSLHFSLKQEEVPSGYQSLMKAVLNPNRPGCELLVANRLWCQQSYRFKDPFLAVNREQFASEIGKVDFKNTEAARRQINAWIEEKTKGRIREAVDPSVVSHTVRDL
jgi:serine protease inhibitor